MAATLEDIAAQVKFDILTKTQEKDNEKLLREISRSFISDTITAPTKEMYAYALRASLGDDVYNDPSTEALEAHMAQLTGKEAALFVPSGTMSNQLALRTHLKQPPYSVLCDHRAHIARHEAGGAAFHSGAHLECVPPSNGHHLTVADVKENVVTEMNIHYAPTEVIALENTLNGTIIPQEDIEAISEFAHSKGIKMHLDGARIWHVAVATTTPIKTLCDPFDSVSICFSKGLGAPIGSCLVGSKEFITKARWFRKLFGGGMRQTSFMAAAAAYALTHNFPLLPGVHALTKKLENGLEGLGVTITSRAETCMVFFDASPIGVNYEEVVDRASKLPDPIDVGGSRLVVHIQTSPDAVEDFLSLMRTLAQEKRDAGFAPTQKKVNGLPNGNIYHKVRT
ncbi:Probable low-specificity L-threonine [Sparassis crispa]|uniref:Probable low-specificity L-threonine n=1 Tax=Sparassis crispa TaxID=139825 RepID=A0A401G7K3_9APHY|nr:Probable low-specificity L-threonine [Sparassis crispa]GBE78137.1 Probable low-specificity L-threonine [Sparassis crispa]